MRTCGWAARNSLAAEHGSCWQLSAPSWMRTTVAAAECGPSFAAASRKALVIGPRPRGLSFSIGVMIRSTSSGAGSSRASVSWQSPPRRWPNDIRPTLVPAARPPSACRKPSRASTSLVCRSPSGLPHIEPEPSKTTITVGGSAARAPGGTPAPAISVMARTTRATIGRHGLLMTLVYSEPWGRG